MLSGISDGVVRLELSTRRVLVFLQCLISVESSNVLQSLEGVDLLSASW